MPSRRRLAALALLIPVALAAFLTATAGGSGTTARHSARAAYFAQVRAAVVRGAARDFAAGTGIGGPDFAACVEHQLREALDSPTITDLAAVYRRPGGPGYAAQTLNAIASPLAAKCGHCTWVPELVDGARRLSFTRPNGAAGRHPASPTDPSWACVAATRSPGPTANGSASTSSSVAPRSASSRSPGTSGSRCARRGSTTASAATTGSGPSPHQGSRRGPTTAASTSFTSRSNSA